MLTSALETRKKNPLCQPTQRIFIKQISSYNDEKKILIIFTIGKEEIL